MASWSNRKPNFSSYAAPDAPARSAGHVPQLPLERAERLLARLVEELLVGVGRLALVLRVRVEPLVDLGAQRGRQMIEQHVLEVRREMDLRRLALREVVERGLRQRRRAVLHRARESVVVARDLLDSPRACRDRASRRRSSRRRSTTPPCDVPLCTLIFERPTMSVGQRRVEAVHVGAQLFDRASSACRPRRSHRRWRS